MYIAVFYIYSYMNEYVYEIFIHTFIYIHSLHICIFNANIKNCCKIHLIENEKVFKIH